MVRKVRNNKNRVDKKDNRVYYLPDNSDSFVNRAIKKNYRTDKNNYLSDKISFDYRVDKSVDLSGMFSKIIERLKKYRVYFFYYRAIKNLKLFIAAIIEHPYIVYRVDNLWMKNNLKKFAVKSCRLFVDAFCSLLNTFLLLIYDCFLSQKVPNILINDMEVV